MATTILAIKELKLNARKEQNKVALSAYDSVLAHADTRRVELKVKNIDDFTEEQTLQSLKKCIRMLKEEMSFLSEDDERYGLLFIQEGYLQELMPAMMSEQELEGLVRDAEALTTLEFKDVLKKTKDYYQENIDKMVKGYEQKDLVAVIKRLISE